VASLRTFSGGVYMCTVGPYFNIKLNLRTKFDFLNKNSSGIMISFFVVVKAKILGL
jgi:hypothetical protein